MNRFVIFCSTALCLVLVRFEFTYGQTPYFPPDLMGQEVSSSIDYTENLGQLGRTDGSQADEVLYYSMDKFPLLFFAENRVSYVYVEPGSEPGQLSSSYRIDVDFVCPVAEGSCESAPVGYTSSAGVAHYYNQHVPSGVTNVHSFQRLVYEEVWPGIDVHYLSNTVGYKFYFVVHEGANPNDIHLRFSGQDQLDVNLNADLELLMVQKTFVFEEGIAYQVAQNGAMTPTGWLPAFSKVGTDEVKLQTGTYNTGEKLVIVAAALPLPPPAPPTGNDQIEWATMFGGAGYGDAGNSMVTDANGGLFVTGRTNSLDLPVLGPTITGYNVFSDVYVTKFNPSDQIEWSTYYGGGGDDSGEGIGLKSNGSCVVATLTNSWDLPVDCGLGNVICNGASNFIGVNDLFVFEINQFGVRVFASYFGGSGEDFIKGPNCLDVDGNDVVRIVGRTSSPDFTNLAATSGSNPFNQSVKGAASEGFLVELAPDLSQFDNPSGVLEWGTYFGTNSDDGLVSVATNSSNEIYVYGGTFSSVPGDVPCGVSTNGGLPLCDPAGSLDYYQDFPGIGFLARFNVDRELIWSTWFGGHILQTATGMVIDDQDNVVVVGNTRADQGLTGCGVPAAFGEFPLCDQGNGAYFQDQHLGETEGYIAQFNSNNELEWSTYYGGSDFDELRAVDVNANGELFITGSTNSLDFPRYFKWGYYFQFYQADNTTNRADAFVAAFDDQHRHHWSTYYGGTYTVNSIDTFQRATEGANAIATGPGDMLYMTGASNAYLFPTECDNASQYCRELYFGDREELDDAFLIRINGDQVTGVAEELYRGLSVAPNPVTDVARVSFTGTIGAIRIELRDITGKLVRVDRMQIDHPEVAFDISVEGLPSGLYLLSVWNGARHFTEKIVVN